MKLGLLQRKIWSISFIFSFCQSEADGKASEDLSTMLPKQIGMENICVLLATLCGEERGGSSSLNNVFKVIAVLR